MKKTKIFLLFSLVAIMMLSFTGCALFGPKDDDGGDDKKSFGLAGDYIIDATELGMPMTWYLQITEDNKFKISSDKEYTSDKGNGTIAKNNDTYVLMYSDSTAENPRTATFKVVDGDLQFTTNILVGTSQLSFPNDNYDKDTFIVPKNWYSEYLGDYCGSLEKQAMGSTLVYDYCLTLETGRKFSYACEYSMMGDTYVYQEKGKFDIKDGKIELTATSKKGDFDEEWSDIASPVKEEGTFNDGKINVKVTTSARSSAKVDGELVKATTSAVAGTYYGLKENTTGMVYTINATLKLGKLGKYEYSSAFASGMMGTTNYKETGSFVITDKGITLTTLKVYDEDEQTWTDAKADTKIEATISNLALTAKLPTGGMPTDMTLYNGNVFGSFVAVDDNVAEDKTQYGATLYLNGDGTYGILTYKEADHIIINNITGTFEVKASPMSTQIILNQATGSKLTGIVSANSINIQNIQIENEKISLAFTPSSKKDFDLASSYTGIYSKQAMGGTVNYNITLAVNGQSYTTTSTYEMMQESYSYIEQGQLISPFDLLIVSASMETKEEETEASPISTSVQYLAFVNADGEIVLPVKTSGMAKDRTILTLSPVAE